MFLTIHVTAIDDEKLPPHPTTPIYNAPNYYEYIPINQLLTTDYTDPNYQHEISELTNKFMLSSQNGEYVIPTKYIPLWRSELLNQMNKQQTNETNNELNQQQQQQQTQTTSDNEHQQSTTTEIQTDTKINNE